MAVTYGQQPVKASAAPQQPVKANLAQPLMKKTGDNKITQDMVDQAAKNASQIQTNVASGATPFQGINVVDSIPGTAAGQTPKPPEPKPEPTPSPQSDNINNFSGQGTATTQIGAGQTGQGGQTLGSGANSLQQLLGSLGIKEGQTFDKFNQSGDTSFDYLTKALQANVDPAFLQNLQNLRNERDRLIDFEFSNKGKTGGQFANQANDMNAYVANELGMAGPGNSVSNATQAELQARREAAANAAKLASLQDYQNQFLAERNRISGVGTTAANTAAGLTNVFGDYSLGTSGLQGQTGNQLGQLGLGQQQIGATNMNTGLDAQNAAISQGLASTGLDAQIQQAQATLRNQFMQQILNNLFQSKNNKYNQQIMDQLIPYIMSSGGGGGFLGF